MAETAITKAASLISKGDARQGGSEYFTWHFEDGEPIWL